jgi:hypothetical protein
VALWEGKVGLSLSTTAHTPRTEGWIGEFPPLLTPCHLLAKPSSVKSMLSIGACP